MLSRRYLRRGLLPILLVPIVLLLLLSFYQSRQATNANVDVHDHPRERLDPPKQPIVTDTVVQPKQSAEQTPQNLPPLSILSIERPTEFARPAVQPITPSPNPAFTFPVIDTKNLHRFVHLDLKGAAPKLSYFEKLFPYLKQLGATGLLIEYEDMFPFAGRLASVRHGLAYSRADIDDVLQLAQKNELQVMPLLQVYGHLEYVLKLREFMHLREDSRYPQVITPCLEESYALLFEMLDQLLALHPTVSFLHIGCDEVYYRLVHPECGKLHFRDEADLFIRHVTRVAKYIKSKRPTVKLFIWHDMVSQLVESGVNNVTELVQLVVPMVWAYVDDVKTWFDDTVWTKFAMFPEVWVASSFKGSSGETTTMSYIGHHQRNQQTWLETMHRASQQQRVNFTGIAITGWSRYDHMLALCEFLPSSIPSLAYALQTVVHGHITDELNQTISEKVLGCTQMPLWERSSFPTYASCKFPGHQMYEIMHKYDALMRQQEETMAFVRLYVTDVHLGQNYIHFKRAEDCLERLIPLEAQLAHFIDTFQNVSLMFFTADIGPEWLQTYVMRAYRDVQQRVHFVDRALKTQSSWPQRPLPRNTSRIVLRKRNSTSIAFARL